MKVEAVEFAFLGDPQQPGGIDRIHDCHRNPECSERDDRTPNRLGFEHLQSSTVKEPLQR